MDEAIDQEYEVMDEAMDHLWLLCPDKASTCNTAGDMEMLDGCWINLYLYAALYVSFLPNTAL